MLVWHLLTVICYDCALIWISHAKLNCKFSSKLIQWLDCLLLGKLLLKIDYPKKPKGEWNGKRINETFGTFQRLSKFNYAERIRFIKYCDNFVRGSLHFVENIFFMAIERCRLMLGFIVIAALILVNEEWVYAFENESNAIAHPC